MSGVSVSQLVFVVEDAWSGGQPATEVVSALVSQALEPLCWVLRTVISVDLTSERLAWVSPEDRAVT